MKRTPADDELLTRALEASTGPALVLDPALRVVDATPEVHALLGFTVPRGVSAASLLCGDRPKRPVAEALAAGRSIQAVIPGPGGDPRPLAVRTTPLRQGRTLVGWVLGLRLAGELGDAPVEFHGMWTRDAAMKRMFRILEKVAVDDVTVLVRGETGSGKELVAHAIHALSPRAHGPLRAINCAALPANLLESELFGHVKVAFTGAVRDTPGHVQLAEGGTLFLDEVAELSAEVQAALLRALETRAVRRVGGTRERPVDVRIVAASATPLLAHVEANRFRDDLYYRLQGDVLQVPALAARREDVLPLARRFVADHAEQRRRAPPRLSSEVEEALVRYDWPGNVRELRQLVARAMALVDGDVIEREHLPERLFPPRGDGGASVLASGGARPAAPVASPIGWPIVLRETLASIERQLVEAALAEARGNVRAAAKLVGLPERTFAYRMELLGVPRG
jgi:DNA-binding NtrC family response regulator